MIMRIPMISPEFVKIIAKELQKDKEKRKQLIGKRVSLLMLIMLIILFITFLILVKHG